MLTSRHTKQIAATMVQEYWRGTSVRRASTGSDYLTALIGLVSRNKRRYGGYIVHLGIVLIFFGFGGRGFEQEQTVRLLPGQETKIGDYTARLDALKITDDDAAPHGRKTVIQGGAKFDRAQIDGAASWLNLELRGPGPDGANRSPRVR